MHRAVMTISVAVYCFVGPLGAVAPATAKDGPTKCMRKCDSKWKDCKKRNKWFCATRLKDCQHGCSQHY